MKLSKTQKYLMEEMKEKLDTVRSCDTYDDYVRATNKAQWIIDEELKNRRYEKYYLLAKNENIVLTITSSATLKALVNRGLIEIVRDGRSNVDLVKVLNY